MNPCIAYVNAQLTLADQTGRQPSLMADVLHRHGRAFQIKDHPLNGSMAMRECFANSIEALEPGQQYCEGYATLKGLDVPMEHAWILDEDGQIIDPTWPDGGHYFGVALKENFVREMIAMTRHFGAFGSAYRLKESVEETRSRFEQAVLKQLEA